MFSLPFKICMILTMLTPVSEALWALELQFTWSDRGFSKIVLLEQMETIEIHLGETRKLGPLERKDIYKLDMFSEHRHGTLTLEFSKEWNVSLSPNITDIRGVEMKHRAVCFDDWYGDDCNTYCVTGVRYHCTKDGHKICFPGYHGKDCTKVTTSSTTTSSRSPVATSSLKPTSETDDNNVSMEEDTRKTDSIQVNRTVCILLVVALILLVVVLIGVCVVAFLRKGTHTDEPLLPTHRQDLGEINFVTPPRLKILSEMMGAKSTEVGDDAPTIRSDCKTPNDMNNNDEIILRNSSDSNQYSSPPSLRDSQTSCLNRDTSAFSVVTLPEPMRPLETNHYASISSPETPKSSRTVKEMVV